MTNELVNTQTGEIVEQPNKLVFGTQEPEQIIDRATKVANRLVDIVEKGKLYNNIQGKKFVRAEGWTAMAAMLGVFPSTEYCRKLDREGETIYEAKIVLMHISGQQVGSGEALCSSKEKNWSNRDEYTIKSMAQTRAVGKACRLSFSWIMAMAGYEACNAEEMTGEIQKTIQMPKAKSSIIGGDQISIRDTDNTSRERDGSTGEIIQEVNTEIGWGEPPGVKEDLPLTEKQIIEAKIEKAFGKGAKLITEKQRKMLFAVTKQADIPEIVLKSYLKEHFNLEHTKDLTMSQFDELLVWVKRYAELNKA